MSTGTGSNPKLAGVVVCITGDPTFDKDENKHIREQFIDENVSRWLKYRGGRLVEEVTKTTTHLICSRAAYKARNDKIKAAKKFGCHIVTYEWLTDTLQLLDYHNKKAPTMLYHPGKARDGGAIASLFRKSEKKPKHVKKAASDGDDARTAEDAADTGSEQLAASGEKGTQKSSEDQGCPKPPESGEGEYTKVVHEIKGLSSLTNNENDKPAGKSENGAKARDQGPPIDLSLYTIYKSDSGLHYAEVRRGDRRIILELYESKSAPKTYLFGMRVHPKPGSSAGIRYFSSKTPGNKECELDKFRSQFLNYNGVAWPLRDANSSSGSCSARQPQVVPDTAGNASHKSKLDELGKEKTDKPTKSLGIPHRHRQIDLKTAFKRKSSSPEKRPAKELKVTKHSVAGGSDKATNGGSKAA